MEGAEPKFTSKSYVNAGGGMCPGCGSYETDPNEQIQGQNNKATQEVNCGKCGARWVDLYALTGYTDFEPGRD